MRTSLKVFSIIAIIIGACAIFGMATEPTLEEAMYSFLGGALFATQGILTLVYLGQTKNK